MGLQAFALDFGAQDLPSACRRAYVQLLTGAHVGWGKVELAEWLTGPYRQIIERASGVADEEWGPISSGPHSAVAGERLAKVLDTMRIDVLLVLHELGSSHGLSAFSSFAFDNGLVAHDVDGLFVPVARPRMSLVDRVLSLVAVDALTRPHDFELAFFVCERCHLPVFDVQARSNGICRVHVSGVQHT
jgi:hypothetical protein